MFNRIGMTSTYFGMQLKDLKPGATVKGGTGNETHVVAKVDEHHPPTNVFYTDTKGDHRMASVYGGNPDLRLLKRAPTQSTLT